MREVISDESRCINLLWRTANQEEEEATRLAKSSCCQKTVAWMWKYSSFSFNRTGCQQQNSTGGFDFLCVCFTSDGPFLKVKMVHRNSLRDIDVHLMSEPGDLWPWLACLNVRGRYLSYCFPSVASFLNSFSGLFARWIHEINLKDRRNCFAKICKSPSQVSSPSSPFHLFLHKKSYWLISWSFVAPFPSCSHCSFWQRSTTARPCVLLTYSGGVTMPELLLKVDIEHLLTCSLAHFPFFRQPWAIFRTYTYSTGKATCTFSSTFSQSL